VWLTDADIRHDPDVLRRLLSVARRLDRDFISVMARLRCDNFYERLLIPAFTYFFAGLFPFPAVGNDRSRVAAAAGGCMLLRSSLLERAGGMETIRDAVIDDVSLGRACKSAGGKLWLGYDRGVVSVRGYQTLGSIWDMVARSAYTQLGYHPLALAVSVVGLLLVFLLPVAAALFGAGPMRFCGLVAYAAMVWTYLPMVRFLGCNVAWALLLPLAAMLYTAMTVSSAWRYYQGTRTHWKGRAYGTAP
jgi:hopene-associated glycosyltransferase HpnB